MCVCVCSLHLGVVLMWMGITSINASSSCVRHSANNSILCIYKVKPLNYCVIIIIFF